MDRTVQVFALPTAPPSASGSGSANGAFGYVETLFGHQDKITDLDALRAETAVSSGGRDKSVRFFKIADETQLVFRGGVRSALREVIEGALDADADVDVVDRKGKGKQKFVEGSMECVAMIDENTFLSGGDSGYVLYVLEIYRLSNIEFPPCTVQFHFGQPEKRSLSSTTLWLMVCTFTNPKQRAKSRFHVG